MRTGFFVFCLFFTAVADDKVLASYQFSYLVAEPNDLDLDPIVRLQMLELMSSPIFTR